MTTTITRNLLLALLGFLGVGKTTFIVAFNQPQDWQTEW